MHGKDSENWLGTFAPPTLQSWPITLKIWFGFKKDQKQGQHYVTNEAVHESLHCC
jgi:hypothetical protein